MKLTISRTSAAVLQKEAMSAEKLFERAVRRCQDAIISYASQGRSRGQIAFMGLTDEQFEELKKIISEAGFDWDGAYRVNEKTHALDVMWEPKCQEADQPNINLSTAKN